MTFQDSFIIARDLGSLIRERIIKGAKIAPDTATYINAMGIRILEPGRDIIEYGSR